MYFLYVCFLALKQNLSSKNKGNLLTEHVAEVLTLLEVDELGLGSIALLFNEYLSVHVISL